MGTGFINLRGLGGLTTNESIIMGGQDGRDITSLFWDVASQERVTDRHAQELLRLSTPFANALSPLSTHRDGTLQTQDGLITPGYGITTKAMGTARETIEGRNFTALNIFSASVNAHGLFTHTLSFPVKWNTGHIDDRMEERGGGYKLDPVSPMFRAHNATALAMLRLLEQKHGSGIYPVLLPERNGVLLGHTVPIPDDHPNNRIFMMSIDALDSFGIAFYEWRPKMHMTVRTFLGHGEMTLAQANLRKALLPFYSGDKAAGLHTEIDRMMDTEKNPRLLPEKYVRAVDALSRVMDSPLWKAALRLPSNLRNAPSAP